ncbi:MAG: hypothetical protein K0S71_3042 [Clostridia bacterium]|jgi:phage tail-like protein|nr:hypothetical protein [Clostridia bacterium]
MYSINQDLKQFKTCRYLRENGLSSRFLENDDGSLTLPFFEKRGYYFTSSFDTLEEEMRYNRIKIKGFNTKDVKLTLCVLALDSPYGEYEGSFIGIDDVLMDEEIEPKNKLAFLLELGAKSYTNSTDVLLHHLQGRFFWAALQVYKLENTSYVFEGIEVEYPMQSFVHYLPEIYQKDGAFLQYFIGIFQSLYLDVEKSIDELPAYLDIETTPDSFLNYLGSWVGIDNGEDIFNAAQMRVVIKKAAEINSGKGTKRALENLLSLYTGTEPKIIEYFYWNDSVSSDKDKQMLYEKLYGKDTSWFTVIIDVSKAAYSLSYEKLQLLIDKYKPAETKYHLVLLEPCNRSDRHCYLDINSYIAEFKLSRIDFTNTLSADAVLQLGE